MGGFCIPLFPRRQVSVRTGQIRSVEVHDTAEVLGFERRRPWQYVPALCRPKTGPQWQDGNERFPITLPIGADLKATAGFRVMFSEPCGGDSMSVAGFSPVSNQALVGSTYMSGGDNEVEVEHGRIDLGRVGVFQQPIHWEITPSHRPPGTRCGDSRHEFIITCGTPRVPSGGRERGFTIPRLRAAAQLVGATNSLDSHTIMRRLNRLFPDFAPYPRPSVGFDHPQFHMNEYGIWPMVDNIAESGECQAIVRFCEAVFLFAGCRGEVTRTWVHADPARGNGAIALETDRAGGERLHERTKVINGKDCLLALIATQPNRGETFTAPANDFEACLILRDSGRRLYYPGGAGGFSCDTPQEVLLTVFRNGSLVWYYWDNGQKVCAEPVARYPGRTPPHISP